MKFGSSRATVLDLNSLCVFEPCRVGNQDYTPEDKKTGIKSKEIRKSWVFMLLETGTPKLSALWSNKQSGRAACFPMAPFVHRLCCQLGLTQPPQTPLGTLPSSPHLSCFRNTCTRSLCYQIARRPKPTNPPYGNVDWLAVQQMPMDVHVGIGRTSNSRSRPTNPPETLSATLLILLSRKVPKEVRLPLGLQSPPVPCHKRQPKSSWTRKHADYPDQQAHSPYHLVPYVQ
jgi:hypothetical protein